MKWSDRRILQISWKYVGHMKAARTQWNTGRGKETCTPAVIMRYMVQVHIYVYRLCPTYWYYAVIIMQWYIYVTCDHRSLICYVLQSDIVVCIEGLLDCEMGTFFVFLHHLCVISYYHITYGTMTVEWLNWWFVLCIYHHCNEASSLRVKNHIDFGFLI